MTALLISVIAFLALTMGITAYGYRRYARPNRYFQQLSPAPPAPVPAPVIVDKKSSTEPSNLVVRVFQMIGEQVPVSPADAGAIRRDLMSAGYRFEQAVPMIFGSKVVCCALMLMVGIIFRHNMPDNTVLRNVFLAAGGYLGYLAPSFWLDRKIDGRRERIRHGLPDALDLTIIAVEAGLGLDQAIQYVGKELYTTHKDVSDELSLVTLEMQAGKRRAEALRNLAQRTGEAELKKLASVLIQADRFGTSIAESLRTHSDFMRVRRRQEAQERASKVGVKLVFPIFFFILPAVMLVAAGPGLLQIFKYLFPMMRNFH